MPILVVIEPWEFGTTNGDGPFNIDLTKGVNGNWLMEFPNPIICEGNSTRYLLGMPQQKHKHLDLLVDSFDKILIQMACIKDLNSSNFKEYDLNNHRGAFLTGELQLNDSR